MLQTLGTNITQNDSEKKNINITGNMNENLKNEFNFRNAIF